VQSNKRFSWAKSQTSYANKKADSDSVYGSVYSMIVWVQAMFDSAFKKFNHNIASGDRIASKGNNIVDEGNYRPDITIENSHNKVYIIMESERKSERKAFIGALVQAAKYAAEKNTTMTLVFVMKETGNQTTVAQVSANIRPYYQWLYALGAKQLNSVLLISDTEYDKSNKANEVLLSQQFKKRCIKL